MQNKNQSESTWYGELYAIHKLKIAATRLLIASKEPGDDEDYASAYFEARDECFALGLTQEILLERLKV